MLGSQMCVTMLSFCIRFLCASHYSMPHNTMDKVWWCPQGAHRLGQAQSLSHGRPRHSCCGHGVGVVIEKGQVIGVLPSYFSKTPTPGSDSSVLLLSQSKSKLLFCFLCFPPVLSRAPSTSCCYYDWFFFFSVYFCGWFLDFLRHDTFKTYSQR